MIVEAEGDAGVKGVGVVPPADGGAPPAEGGKGAGEAPKISVHPASQLVQTVEPAIYVHTLSHTTKGGAR